MYGKEFLALQVAGGRAIRKGILAFLTIAVAGLAFAGAASALEPIDYFGSEAGSGTAGGQFTDPGAVAVNETGAGPAEASEIYVADTGNNRVQRYARNENGTPGDFADDTYEFRAAWGAGVDANVGGPAYQICTTAAACQSGVPAGGNGALNEPLSVAVDQDTGEVYVADSGNKRINVYAGDGTFLRSFGFDVVASGPGDVTGPAEKQELTIKATGGKFSLFFEGKTTGARGTAWRPNPNRTVLPLFVPLEGTFHVGDSVSGEGIPPETTITDVSGSELTISKPTINSTTSEAPIYVDNFNYNASASELEAALNALPSIGGAGGSVTVTGGPGNGSGSSPYLIEFGGNLADRDLPNLEATQGGLANGGSSASATVAELEKGGAYEVCVAAEGDVCRAGSAGDALGEIGGLGRLVNRGLQGLAITQPDGNTVAGTVYFADSANLRINSYDLDGSSPVTIGSAADFGAGFEPRAPGPLAIDSRGILYAGDVQNEGEIDRYDTMNANGGGIGFLAPIGVPPLVSDCSFCRNNRALAVDPDSDGGGPDTDILFVGRNAADFPIQQFGPINEPGLAPPPVAADATTTTGLDMYLLAVEQATGRILVPAIGGDPSRHGVFVLGVGGGPSSATLDSVSDITATSATLHGTVTPNGLPAASYRLEYSTDGTDWSSTSSTFVGAQTTPQTIEAVLNPPGGGLKPKTLYHVRLVVTRLFRPDVVTPELTFTTLPAPAGVETVGAPVRTATTAQLGGRVNPRGSATTYHFEYGTQGPCSSNPCTSTPSMSAGSGSEIELISEAVENLQPGTTYHYRLIADNGEGGPQAGADRTFTSLASDAPLSHGRFPGPPGSDRAWEQVNAPDVGGNLVDSGLAFSDDGNRAVYLVKGGTPFSDTGTLFNTFMAERTGSGWQTRNVYPPRALLTGSNWLPPVGSSDLSSFIARNASNVTGDSAIWHMGATSTPVKLADVGSSTNAFWYTGSADGSRAVVAMSSTIDPEYPVQNGANLYDVSSGSPKLASILPGDSVSPCGIYGGALLGGHSGDVSERATRWVSDDGSLLFFGAYASANCAATMRLYVRNLDAAPHDPVGTRLISTAPITGPECDARFLKSTPTAAFFITSSRLSAEDQAPAGCNGSGGDVYRYDLASGDLECVTCVSPGEPADVSDVVGNVAIASDGSRVYFRSDNPLLPGVPPGTNIYRILVSSGALAFVAHIESSAQSRIGEDARAGQALNTDGSVLVFSGRNAWLNPLGGSDNGGFLQYYRYDDKDRSLICVSCTRDGSAPVAAVPASLFGIDASPVASQAGPNLTPLNAEGNLAFITPSPLLPADQNTAGPSENPRKGWDVYEWRAGRLLLVTDGVTDGSPQVNGFLAGGHDLFFTVAAQYTPDALDKYRRLYDARIGGGFEFPQPSPPCALEACQGIPKGAPAEQAPSSADFRGPGNASPAKKRKCTKPRVRRHGRCVRKHSGKHRKHRHAPNKRFDAGKTNGGRR
jgi:NHL repeat